MANSTVSIFIRFKSGGKRQTVAAAYVGKARLKPGIGKQNGKEFPCPAGVYWLRWYDGPKQVWKRVGIDPTDALKAQMRQEAVLAGETVPADTPKGVSRVTLASAVEDFLAERSTQTDERGLKRWRWELELFQNVCGGTYLHEVSRADCFVYMKWFQIRKKKPRTVYNRMVGLGVFLKAAKHTVDFVFSQRKDNGQIPDYSEKTVDRYTTLDLKRFFAACDAEARLRYLFFLDTGCREREVMFACQEDFMFEAKDCECASTYEVRPKPELGFRTKKDKTRMIPLTPRLAEALQTWFAIVGDRRLVFVNRDGMPERHFLYKHIALKAGLNCGHCKTGKKDEFGNIIPGTELCCKTSPVCSHWTLHKMRRTWATMLLEQPGVNIYEVQERIGHSDLEMLKRYNAVAQARSPRARQQMSQFAESVDV